MYGTHRSAGLHHPIETSGPSNNVCASQALDGIDDSGHLQVTQVTLGALPVGTPFIERAQSDTSKPRRDLLAKHFLYTRWTMCTSFG